MWQQNWSVNTTYCSPYTGVAVSPYCNGYTAEAAYCGQVLLKDIEALLREEKPTVILFPSNYDGHPDHWATNAFVSYALEELKLQGWQFKPKVYNYLVHYTDWPRPWGANLVQELGPPAGIAGESQWLTLWLSWSERIKKHNAILLHKSQVAVMQGFLTSFARSTELFHSYPSELILEPDEQTVLATDAHGDSLGDRLDRYTDITCLSGKLNDTELELALSLTGAVRSNVKCELELVVLGGNLPRQRLLLSYPAKELPSGITAKSEGNEILFTVPRSLLGKAPLLFVAAETYQGQMRADRLCQIRVQLR